MLISEDSQLLGLISAWPEKRKQMPVNKLLLRRVWFLTLWHAHEYPIPPDSCCEAIQNLLLNTCLVNFLGASPAYWWVNQLLCRLRFTTILATSKQLERKKVLKLREVLLSSRRPQMWKTWVCHQLQCVRSGIYTLHPPPHRPYSPSVSVCPDGQPPATCSGDQGQVRLASVSAGRLQKSHPRPEGISFYETGRLGS